MSVFLYMRPYNDEIYSEIKRQNGEYIIIYCRPFLFKIKDPIVNIHQYDLILILA